MLRNHSKAEPAIKLARGGHDVDDHRPPVRWNDVLREYVR